MRCRLRQVGEMSVQASGEVLKDRRPKLSFLQAGRNEEGAQKLPGKRISVDNLFWCGFFLQGPRKKRTRDVTAIKPGEGVRDPPSIKRG